MNKDYYDDGYETRKTLEMLNKQLHNKNIIYGCGTVVLVLLFLVFFIIMLYVYG